MSLAIIHDPRVLAAASLAGIDDERTLHERGTRETAGQNPGRLAADDVGAQIDVPRCQSVFGPRRTRGETDLRLSDEVARLGKDLLAKLGPLLRSGRWPHQHAITARLVDRLHHQ